MRDVLPRDPAARLDAGQITLSLRDTWNNYIFSYNILRTYLRNLANCNWKSMKRGYLLVYIHRNYAKRKRWT
jgi:hypothetical protein